MCHIRSIYFTDLSFMRFKRTLFCVSLLLWSAMWGVLSAQTALLQKQADKAMEELDYMTAIALYLQVLNKKDVPEAALRLADCYRKINDTEQAAFWYGKAIDQPQAAPEHYLYYGMMLQANGDCAAAKPWFEKFSNTVPDDGRGQAQLEACARQAALLEKNKQLYAVFALPFNSNADDYCPALWGDQLVFASDRDKGGPIHRTNMWTGTPFSELYKVHFQTRGNHPGQYAYQYPTKFSNHINTKYHEAAVAFSPDGKTVYFTRNGYQDGKTERDEEGLLKLRIFYAAMSGHDGWSEPSQFAHNNKSYNVAHPALSPDGQSLFFASDMPGGYGGMDLYVSQWDNGRWGTPVNLGPAVNTAGSELFPSMRPDRRLYFASDGHAGLGRLDIFSTSETTLNHWQAPINMGAPINSSHDDFGIVWNADLRTGFFTSDRPGGAGRDDLYGFQEMAVRVQLLVLDSETKAPIPNASFVLSAGENRHTNAAGNAMWSMAPDTCLTLNLTAENYLPAAVPFCTKGVPTDTTLKVTATMNPFRQYVIQGVTINMTYGLPASSARVELWSNCTDTPVEVAVTGSDGHYRFVVEKGCCYRLRAALDGYWPSNSPEMCYQDYNLPPSVTTQQLLLVPLSEQEPNNPTLPTLSINALRYNPTTKLYEEASGRLANGNFGNGLRIINGVLFETNKPVAETNVIFEKSNQHSSDYLLNVYYDFNEANVRQESVPALEKLLQLLRDDSSIRIEIGAHTDVRGSEDYNLGLSQRRASAVVQWLQQRGVAADRLVAKGYGKSKPLNACSPPEACTEQEHSRNRRTVFTILSPTEIDPRR